LGGPHYDGRMVEYEETGGASSKASAGGSVEIIRGLNAFRLTLFGILVSIGLTAWLGFAALDGALAGVVAGVLAPVGTALALRLLRRQIAELMAWLVPGE